MSRIRLGAFFIFLLIMGCAHSRLEVYEAQHTLFAAQNTESLAGRFAPVFLTYRYREVYNRIGRPSARFDDQGNEEIYVDPRHPVIYYMAREFSTSKGSYTNLIYRIHFPEVPYSLIPFNFTAGMNVGLLTIITIDNKRHPVLVTTVGTCGCYAAVVPTNYLPRDAYPEGWRDEPQKIYGERLPWLLDYQGFRMPRLLVHIGSGLHRVTDLEITEEQRLRNPGLFNLQEAPLVPMDSLEKIPLDGGATSFYYDTWPLKGHVKGSWKPWETLSLSLISFDFFVGMDKIYGDSRMTGNRFYTSLKPWNRAASDLWDFEMFLRFMGWRL